MKIRCRWVVSILFLLATSFPAAAQWRDGPKGYPGRWGGCNCRMMDITPQPVDPASLPHPSTPGAKILQSKCVQCHGLVSPRQEASRDWPYIVDRMDRRMWMMARGGMGMMMRSGISPLPPEEKSTLLTYLQDNAFQAMAPSAVPDSREPGARAFIQTCSRCHALPETSAHTPEEWREVVKRMVENMETMDDSSLAPEQEKAILGFLEKHARK